MIKVILDYHNPNADICSDGLCGTYVKDALKKYRDTEGDITFRVGTGVMFNHFRIAVKKGAINISDIEFATPNGKVEVNEKGKIKGSHDYVCFWESSLHELL